MTHIDSHRQTAVLLTGDRVHVAGEGDLAVVPPGLMHAFAAAPASDADLLIVITPGVERFDYFRHLARIATGRQSPDSLLEVQSRYDTFFGIPEGGYIGVFPAALNRDPERLYDPDEYLPDRFRAQSPHRLALFGRGAFRCAAQQFSRTLIVGVLDELLRRKDITRRRQILTPARILRSGR
jgi:hypothetical protein